MAEVIQFNCPVCGTMLRLPLSMAGLDGPCPTCARDIVAPDPYRGVGAYEIPAVAPAFEMEPYEPFAESPPIVPREREMVPASILPPPEPPVVIEPESPVPAFAPFRFSTSTASVPPEPTPEAGPPIEAPLQAVPARSPSGETPRSAILILSCLLTAIVALLVGFLLGAGTQRFFRPDTPAPVSLPAEEVPLPPLAKESVPEKPREEPPVKIPPAPLPEPAPENPAPPPEPLPKVSAAAEASLRAFLDAPDWASRAVYSLFPEKLRAAMASYSHEVPDGPTPYESISVKQSQVDESTGQTLFIFMVSTDLHPDGIPVAVQETTGGWLVDWQTFVEFRDRLFRKFVGGPPDKTGRFHLIVSAPPEARAANTENEHFSSYLLRAPMGDEPQLAYVKKDSAIHSTIHDAVAGGGIFTPVLDVSKRRTTAGQDYFEIVEVKAVNWRPAEN